MHPEKQISRFNLAITTARPLILIMNVIAIMGISGCTSLSRPHSELPSVTFKFAVTDDSRAPNIRSIAKNGVSTVVMETIVKDIAAQKVDFVLFPGDMVSGETDSITLGSELETWNETVKPLIQSGILVYVTRGNHEYFSSKPSYTVAVDPGDPNKETYLAHFKMPVNGPAGEVGLTYSFTWKNAKIIAFDQYVGRKANYSNLQYSQGSNSGQAMNSWVLKEINESTAGVNFVMAHEMMWPSFHSDCLANDPDSRDALVHALGVHNGVYFSGHDHLYARGIMTNADGDKVPVFTMGTAGAGNYKYQEFDVVKAGYTGLDKYYIQKPIYNETDPVFGYLLVTVYSDNSWHAEFRAFQFNHWNDPSDISLTPMTVLDSCSSTDCSSTDSH